MGMGMGSNGMDMGMEQQNPIIKLYESLPPWGQSAVMTLLVILGAALVGMLIGKLYASVRYPDPEKQSAIPPAVRAVFLIVLLLCGAWLYYTLSKKDADSMPVDGDMSMIGGEGAGGAGGGSYGTADGGGVMIGGGMAVSVG